MSAGCRGLRLSRSDAARLMLCEVPEDGTGVARRRRDGGAIGISAAPTGITRF